MSINPVINSVNTLANRNLTADSRSGVKQPKQPVKASIFYINDIHGKSINMERLASASNALIRLKKHSPMLTG